MADYRTMARRAAKKYGVDPDIFERQIGAESGFNPGARSPAGAQGIAQFMPATAKQYGVNTADPKSSLDGAARLMRDALRKNGGSYERALSVYNSGRPDGYKRFGETKSYVAKILGGKAPTASATNVEVPEAPSLTDYTSSTPSAPAVPTLNRQDVLKQYVLDRGKPGAMASLSTGLAAVRAQSQVAPAATANSQAPSRNSKPSQGTGRADVLELFWQGPGGVNVKNGKRVPQGFVSGHTDHVHAAADPKTIVKLGKLAQSMGLHVGENPHFGTVNPVHVPNSHHYAGKAIDVSGDPAKMAAFARRVAKLSGAR